MDESIRVRLPVWIELTPNGKTLVTVYPGRNQGMIIARCLKMFGGTRIHL